MIEGPTRGWDAVPPPHDGPRAYELATHGGPPYAVPTRRSRLDRNLGLLVGADMPFLGWSLVSGTAPTWLTRSHTEFVEIPVVVPAGAAGAMSLDEAEAFAATYKEHRDSKGSHVESGQDVTRAFGAELVWADSDTPDPASGCSRDLEDDTPALAFLCGLLPGSRPQGRRGGHLRISRVQDDSQDGRGRHLDPCGRVLVAARPAPRIRQYDEGPRRS